MTCEHSESAWERRTALYKTDQQQPACCVQMLCAKGANTLQTKSQTVEEAANELINMLCDVEPREAAPEEEEEEDAGFDEEEVAEG